MKAATESTLPVKLRQLRMLIGYSQEALAVEWQMSQAAMSKLEAGKAVITLKRVAQAARFYRLTIDELINEGIKTLSVKTPERQADK